MNQLHRYNSVWIITLNLKIQHKLSIDVTILVAIKYIQSEGNSWNYTDIIQHIKDTSISFLSVKWVAISQEKLFKKDHFAHEYSVGSHLIMLLVRNYA